MGQLIPSIQAERKKKLEETLKELAPAFEAVVDAANEAYREHKLDDGELEVLHVWESDMSRTLGLERVESLNLNSVEPLSRQIIKQRASVLATTIASRHFRRENVFEGRADHTHPPVLVQRFRPQEILKLIEIPAFALCLGSCHKVSPRYCPLSRRISIRKDL